MNAVQNPHVTELLSTTDGKMNGEPVVVLSFRLKHPDMPKTPATIVISAKQALRLLHDLKYLRAAGDILKDVPDLDPEEFTPHIPKPKKTRKKK
jgi:hypothetical protein